MHRGAAAKMFHFSFTVIIVHASPIFFSLFFSFFPLFSFFSFFFFPFFAAPFRVPPGANRPLCPPRYATGVASRTTLVWRNWCHTFCCIRRPHYFSQSKPSRTRGYLKHARGYHTQARGYLKHARGYHTQARGYLAHAREYLTPARMYLTHARWYLTHARGYLTHAKGYLTRNAWNMAYGRDSKLAFLSWICELHPHSHIGIIGCIQLSQPYSEASLVWNCIAGDQVLLRLVIGFGEWRKKCYKKLKISRI